MKAFSAMRAKSHLTADDKFAANVVKKCASPPAHVKKQFYDILVAADAKKVKRKTEGELKEAALEKKHKKSADALRQQQGQQTIAQSLNGSVSKQVCDLAVARFYFANGISERAIESKTWKRHGGGVASLQTTWRRRSGLASMA